MDNNIWFALLILTTLIILGLHEWRYERKQQKARKVPPVDNSGLNFDRCSEEEFERKVAELRKETEGKTG